MNIPLDATAQLPQEQQKALLKAIEQLQIRDRYVPYLASTVLPFLSMRLYNNLVERCFNHCIESFRSKSLDATEEKVNLNVRKAPTIPTSVHQELLCQIPLPLSQSRRPIWRNQCRNGERANEKLQNQIN